MNGQFRNRYDLTGLKYFFIAVIAGEAAGLVLSPLETSRGGMAFIFIGLCLAGGLWREYVCGLAAIPARVGDKELKKSCQRVWKVMCPAIVCGLILIPLVDYLMIRTMDDITNLSFDTAGSWVMIMFVACGVGILGLVAVILLLVQTWNVYSRYHETPVGLRLEDICPQCGSLLRQGVRFCENCGTRIPWRS